MIPPFKQLKQISIKIANKLKILQPRIIKLIQTSKSFGFISQLYKQTLSILLLVMSLAIYVYIKFFKHNKKNTKQENKKPSKLIKHLDQISEHSIIPKKKHKPTKQDDLDSCCQEIQNIHKNLNTKMSNQDKLFLQILKQYQDIDNNEMQRKFQFNQVFYEADQQTNKEVFDNSSTQEGCIKTISKNIGHTASKYKRDQDLNKSF